MTCKEARPLIEAGVEREELQREATLHLNSCVACSELLAELETLQVELAQRPSDLNSDVSLAAIRAEVMGQISGRSPWPHRLKWAAVAVVLGGSGIVGRQALQPEPMPNVAMRLEVPEAPGLAFETPQVAPPVKPVAPAQAVPPPVVQPEPTADAVPEIRLAAVIPPDPETNRRGGVLLQLESENPEVVLYLVADNQGDLL
jgi:hypothetical protein